MKKKALSLFLALLMLVTVLPVSAFAADDQLAPPVELEEVFAEEPAEAAAPAEEAAPEEAVGPAEETPAAEIAATDESISLWDTVSQQTITAEPWSGEIDPAVRENIVASLCDVGDNVYAESEYNDDFGYADPLYDDSTYSGKLTYHDVDIYKFTVAAKSEIMMLLEANKEGVAVGIYDSTGEIQGVSTSLGYDDGYYWELLTGTCTAGTWYLCILDLNSETNGTSSYLYYFNYMPLPGDLHTVSNVISGVRLRWYATTGATRYGVWRSTTKDGEYTRIASVSTNTYIDTSAVSGKTYYYAISTYDSHIDDHSELYSSKGIVFVGTPKFTLRVNRATGIGLRWEKITGATGYAVYRKSYSGTDAWVRVATCAGNDNTAWDDTSVKSNNGTIYRYTVRALAGSNMKTLSGCYNTGFTMVRLTSQTLNSVSRHSAGAISASWSANSKATGYELRAINVSTGEIYTATIGNYKTTSGNYNGLVSGYEYKIQVRSYKKVTGVGSFYSAWSTAKYVWV